MSDQGLPRGLSEADDSDNCSSSSGSVYVQSVGYMIATMEDESNAQLVTIPVGVAEATPIASARNRKKAHCFETNPSKRSKVQNYLLRRLRRTIDEFIIRTGQQAIVLVATPEDPHLSYRSFGAKPLEDIIRNLTPIILDQLESGLTDQSPPPVQDDPLVFILPPFTINGIPTSLSKMTQAQLRAFIPFMLKYSTGRGKPGWGKNYTRPPWWPIEVPWANVRKDPRTKDEKKKISWTNVLRQIITNCYRYHGREDLLNGMIKENTINAVTTNANVTPLYTPAVLYTPNPDGTISVIQVDPDTPIIKLPDDMQNIVNLKATLNCDGQIISTSRENSNGGYNINYLPVSIQHLYTNDDSTVSAASVVQALQVEPNNTNDMDF